METLEPKNFIHRNPSRLVMGKDSLDKLPSLLPKDKTIVWTMGVESIKKYGLYERIKQKLSGFKFVEFSGIQANPDYSVCMKCVKIIKDIGPDNVFLLATGGGSVIDGTKFIASASYYTHSEDPWEILQNWGEYIEKAIPFGCILTMPATGSETNDNAVISRREWDEKLAFGTPLCYPEFALLDPRDTYSLPLKQVINGVVDSYVHVCEQYVTTPRNNAVSDRYAEAILKVIITEGPKALKMDPFDYTARYNYMYAANQALNKLICCGVDEDWATHMMGHEMTAYLGLDHGQTLAIILPRLMEYKIDKKEHQLAMMAENVWGVTEGTMREKAQKCIIKTEEFFHKIGQKTKVSDYTEINQNKEWIQKVKSKFTKINKFLGEHGDIMPDDVEKIFNKCY